MAKRTGPTHDDKTDVTQFSIVVNGVETQVTPAVTTQLKSVVQKALEQTNNVGQTPENWELKTEGGVVLDQSQTVAGAGIKANAKLFLNLRAGAAGDQ